MAGVAGVPAALSRGCCFTVLHSDAAVAGIGDKCSTGIHRATCSSQILNWRKRSMTRSASTLNSVCEQRPIAIKTAFVAHFKLSYEHTC